MQILIPDSHLRDYLDTKASAREIQKALSLCSVSIERLHTVNGDKIYDIEVTTNRPDLMSVVGIAQEAVTILPRFGFPARLLKNPLSIPPRLNLARSIPYLKAEIDKTLCPLFAAHLIRNVKTGPSPAYLASRLKKAGLRPINNLVDITNYLMLELGQPLHVFDYDKITGQHMILRKSMPGETIITLDEKHHKLKGGDIVIEDGGGKLIDLCGIMGGQHSAVSETTQNVLLFVQTYAPAPIRRTSMYLSQRTQAAVLFEKNLPHQHVLPTLRAALDLLGKHAAGEPVKQTLVPYLAPESHQTIKFTMPIYQYINQRMGATIKTNDTKKILTSLGLHITNPREIVVPPSRAHDLLKPEDILEEVARVYGYHNLPSTPLSGVLPPKRSTQQFYWEQKIKDMLSGWGFTETYTPSLVPRQMEPNPHALRLRNPLSTDLEYLRTTLVPSGLKVVADNLGKADPINIFEIANVYLPQKSGLPHEESYLAVTTTQGHLKLKGISEALTSKLGLKIAPAILNHTSPRCHQFVINLSKILKNATLSKTYIPIPKFSPLLEMINVYLAPDQKYQEIVEQIRSTSPLVTNVELEDVYHSKLTLKLTYNSPDRQLSSEDLILIREELKKLFKTTSHAADSSADQRP